MQFASDKHLATKHLATKHLRHRQELGKRGESFAAGYLRQRGSDIIAANVRYRVGELDLIAREPDGTIVFVEVKTRSTASFGIAEAVTPHKLSRMRRAAVQWLGGKPLATVRFDVIALVVKGEGFELEHFTGVDDGPR
ncbi:YraN family protein [Corynebacterium macginleyi]|uniref:YraN family protein n=1 Tax=Corynebacterium macginleyi TaxID=38290 RepID=UPI001909FCAD|nr:YraN family protein [Corynebacterium macginleyi]MBK4145801.1 YraN family protein [Corynebacterium macginleyi]MBM0262122.1 YraN family protein [Corynebacterium macginleyi]